MINPQRQIPWELLWWSFSFPEDFRWYVFCLQRPWLEVSARLFHLAYSLFNYSRRENSLWETVAKLFSQGFSSGSDWEVGVNKLWVFWVREHNLKIFLYTQATSIEPDEWDLYQSSSTSVTSNFQVLSLTAFPCCSTLQQLSPSLPLNSTSSPPLKFFRPPPNVTPPAFSQKSCDFD